jgi:hypothetical protein
MGEIDKGQREKEAEEKRGREKGRDIGGFLGGKRQRVRKKRRETDNQMKRGETERLTEKDKPKGRNRQEEIEGKRQRRDIWGGGTKGRVHEQKKMCWDVLIASCPPIHLVKRSDYHDDRYTLSRLCLNLVVCQMTKNTIILSFVCCKK